MVLWWHFIVCNMRAPANTISGYVYKLTHHAYSGVDLFFVLSGFLITRILLKEIGTTGWLTRFWIRRTFRILPVYFLFLAISVVVAWLNPGVVAVSLPEPLWPYLVMLQNFQMAWANSLGSWGQLWSLAIEEQFYLIFPFVLLLPSSRRWLPGLAILAIALSSTLRMNTGGLSGFVLPHTRLDGLAIGVCLGALSLDRAKWTWITRRFSVIRCGTVLGFLGLGAITLRSQQRHPIDHTVFALSYGAILLDVVAFPTSRLASVLAIRPLIFLGIISYPLYLFHPLCEWAILNKTQPNLPLGTCLLNALVLMPVSILLGWGINRWFGDPFLSWGRSWANSLKTSPPSVLVRIPESTSI